MLHRREDVPAASGPLPPGLDVRSLADAIPHSVWVISAPGKIVYANPHAVRYTGVDARAAGPAGLPWVSIVHPDDIAAVERRAAIAGLLPEPFEIDCRISRADGSSGRLRVGAAPLFDNAGLVRHWIATGTEGEAPTAPPHEPEHALQSVIMNDMIDGLYVVDGDGRLTAINRAASEMLGWQEEELLGRPVHAVLHTAAGLGTPKPESECALWQLRMSGRSTPAVDDVFTRKDGSSFDVTCSVAPLDAGDGKLGAVVTFRDMTELRHAELELRHAQKLESLGRLSAGLAHEINTPIQFVGDNTRFLADACQDMLELLLVYRECLAPDLDAVPWTDRVRRAQAAEDKADMEYLTAEIPAAVSQSLEGVDRVASLVRAMKSFSYKDSTEQAYADLNEAVRTTLTVARNEVKYVADVVLDLGELPDVRCHLGDLNQVFLNLLVNAADALKETGERGEIRFSSRVDGASAVIVVADNGPGIPEDIQSSIFDPFFTTKEVGKGTGQGLALARAVLDKHGGSIEMRSRPGEGAVFTLRLPIDGVPA
jgi:two-component system NtrC family sensor kinase